MSQNLNNAKQFASRVRRKLGTIKRALRASMNGSNTMKMAFPSDNKRLTQNEFKRCCDLIDYYVEEGKKIIPYSKEHNRNPDLFDRGNCWLEGWVDAAVNMMLSKKYNNVNRLRLIAFHFSAYRAFDVSWGTEPSPNEWYHNFYSKGVEELPDDVDSIIKSTVANPVERIQTLVPRLQAFMNSIDNKYLHSLPLRLSEVAGSYRGIMINGDSQRYWGAMVVLKRSGVLDHIERKIAQNGFCRLMEIGAGFGGLAYQLKKTYGDKLQYVAVDLVQSLIFSACYLSVVLDEKTLYYKDEKTVGRENGLVFVPTFRSPEFFNAVHDIDVCINTASMNEMGEAQVEYYASNLTKSLSPDGVFFECNWHAVGAITAGRIEVKPIVAPHFKDRLDLPNTEIACDGNLDIWSNALPPVIEAACIQNYDAAPAQRKRAA